jgi:ribosomal-protein-alanine N-acetyltransferase
MSMELRRWTQKDLPKLALLERACFTDPWTTEMLKGEFSREYAFGIVAEAGGEVLGYTCGLALFDDAELMRIAVLPDYRGQGIGKALLDALFKTALSLGAKRVFLEVRASNEVALGLYRSRGFEKTRLRKRYYASGEDGLEMKKELISEEE